MTSARNRSIPQPKGARSVAAVIQAQVVKERGERSGPKVAARFERLLEEEPDGERLMVEIPARESGCGLAKKSQARREFPLPHVSFRQVDRGEEELLANGSSSAAIRSRASTASPIVIAARWR